MATLASLCHRLGGSDAAKRAGRNARRAQTLLVFFFLGAFAIVSGRVIHYGASANDMPVLAAATTPIVLAKSRPDILDRRGRLLATDIRFYWLSADPQKIVDADEAAQKIAALFPDVNQAQLAKKLHDKTNRFEWVKRGLTPKEAEAVHALGVPALTLTPTNQRVYPDGYEAAHILGITNVDNEGLSGVERHIDLKLASKLAPASLTERPAVKLSLDLSVQHVLREELSHAMALYGAKAVLGLVLDVRNGEVLASASLPDFDPNRRGEAGEQNGRNRVVTDVYELGSVFKSLTIAMALDQGIANRAELFDASPLEIGNFLLRDPHAARQMMSVEDIFIHSSNTGAARIAMAVGAARQQAFLKSLGLFEKIETEAGTSPTPVFPRIWRPSNAITIAYGHGIAVPPLLFASAMATLVNGGERIKPTFLLSEKGADEQGERLVQPQTSAVMRDLMRLVVERGTGRRAAVPGIGVGGKTGTAWKVKEGRYSHDVMNSFVAAFPIEAPKYLVMVTLDEPKPEQPGKINEASQNAAPTAGAIIKRIAPMLDILPTPRFDEPAATPYEQAAPRERQRFDRGNPHEISGFNRGYSAYGQYQYSPGYENYWRYGR